MSKPWSATYQRWPEPDGPWQLRLFWQEVAGRLECVGVELWGGPPRPDRGGSGPWTTDEARPITTEALRSVPLASLTKVKRDEMTERLRRAASEPATAEEAADVLDRWEKAGRRGARPRYSAEHFRRVAEVYEAEHRAGRPPTTGVASHFYVSKSTAAKWVARARAGGMLPPTTRGRPAARPAPRTRKER